ncbi:MAG: glycerol-3-phosphate dehydrogenase/oxidase [Bacteroidota bacterium]|nr:glycerol-3-phosphate dehydrogenase/oxidase [Bacteroidota bacterium]MDP4214843.1 glycerol-3-phosphate dehydrogenase/oxidase [Bacteroidota bacterium]MDP4247726.1 glycerol-3-phosphate dehydrogenase/oxidase [Bacteroidota bacterium]MDP4259041.1 glycerol-3-phosphate dehydrogenase/oxidase [Bacteroidota bacterium]
MKRADMLSSLEAGEDREWDLIVIGGGATGLGVAVDSASRGFRTVLLEQHDFAKGTSSRSTKLVHGGVRYLQQGNIKLVTEALHERGILRRNAPHLVKDQSFIVPNYKWWEGPYYGIGLKVYDWMAGSLGLGTSRILSKEETLELAPTLDADGLRGGVLYHDGQFDDARLAVSLARTAAEQGALVLNYCRVEGLLKDKEGMVTGLLMREGMHGSQHRLRAKVVVNATGVFTDSVLQMDEPGSESVIAPSQGVHIVLDHSFLPGEAAILVPHTDDGRVLFAVPWHGRIIVGTTDTPVSTVSEEPTALPEEIDFILRQIGRYLVKPPGRKDILSVFAGLRPLVKGSSKKTAELSRDHLITVSASGLITVAGGKWTTYRRMAEDTVNVAIGRTGLPDRECVTNHLLIHGWDGSDKLAAEKIAGEDPSLNKPLHAGLPYTLAEIALAAREESCMTVEDALSRRTRMLLLDARAAMQAAPAVAALLAKELGRDEAWQRQQIADFQELAKGYLAE